MSESTPAGVAAFDFDGTLVPGDSLIPFLARVCGAGAVIREFALSTGSLLWAERFRLDRDTSKADLVARLLTGYPEEKLASEGEAYGRDLVSRVRAPMTARLDWHRSQGHRLLLVSASLQTYLEPFGSSLGFDAVLATRLEAGPGGRLTGRLDGPNCRGPEKETRVRDWLARHADGAPVELWAYGDSSGDRELLAMADHPKWIRRRDEMLSWLKPRGAKARAARR